MCGRFLSLSSPQDLAERFEVDEIRTEPLAVRHNVAPSTALYAIIDHEEQRRLGTLRWGFLAPWATDLRHRPQPINARVETVASSRMFRPAFERRRCLLPADGFYEWQDRGEGRRKQPFHLADPDGAPLAFAGIYTTWRPEDDADADPVASTAIVTTEAAGAMRDIHHRMPVILPPTLWHDWLRPTDDAPHLLEAIRSMSPPALRATPITDRVNSVRNDGPELLEPGTVDD
ncbi:MAG: SOS response-associated peptidase [Nitriliruptoraceae bacterium]|nr:SOS response-associated peptidase [Nitriliruptoraceae bacterium]